MSFINTSSFKNKIINGDFRIWQRGTTFPNPSNSFTADRWLVVAGGASIGDSVTRESFVPGQIEVPGNPEFFLKDTTDSIVQNRVIVQRIEDVRVLANKTVTLSFWAKSDVAIPSTSEILQEFGIGGSAPTNFVKIINLTTTWTKFVQTVTLPSVSTKILGIGHRVTISPLRVLPGTSNNAVYMANVQLEEGPVATEFEERHISKEYELCYRYTQVLGSGTADEVFGSGVWFSTNQAWIFYPYIVEMRAIPSISFTGTLFKMKIGLGNDTVLPASIAPASVSKISTRFQINSTVSSLGSSFNKTILSANNPANEKITIDAEL